jgi:hypothetical protein
MSAYILFFSQSSSDYNSFRYELDLMIDGGFGYGLPGDMGPVLGSLYVNKLLERFVNCAT